MLIDVNECPLCGGRKTDTDFCDACTEEMDAAPKWRRPLAAIEIARRNGRFTTYFERGKRSARAAIRTETTSE